MATFPKLKTEAVAQYPATKALRFATEVVGFVDGREQRYRDYGTPLRQWTIRLNLLDEAELARLERFFLENQGAFGRFAFTDPWDGTEHADCSIGQDAFESILAGEMRGHAALVVRENRS